MKFAFVLEVFVHITELMSKIILIISMTWKRDAVVMMNKELQMCVYVCVCVCACVCVKINKHLLIVTPVIPPRYNYIHITDINCYLFLVCALFTFYMLYSLHDSALLSVLIDMDKLGLRSNTAATLSAV